MSSTPTRRKNNQHENDTRSDVNMGEDESLILQTISSNILAMPSTVIRRNGIDNDNGNAATKSSASTHAAAGARTSSPATTGRIFRNSATQMVMNIIDSPRRVLMNRKKMRLNSAGSSSDRGGAKHKSSSRTDTPGAGAGVASMSRTKNDSENHFHSASLQPYLHPGIQMPDALQAAVTFEDPSLSNNAPMGMGLKGKAGMYMSLAASTHMSQNCAFSCPSPSRRQKRYRVFQWLQEDAPQDIIPKVLSFAGPQMIQILSRVNTFWRDECTSEAVFRTLCEDTGKWIPGKHPEPKSQSQVESSSSHSELETSSEASSEATSASGPNRRNFHRIIQSQYSNDDDDQDMHTDTDTDIDTDSDSESMACNTWREYYCNNPIVPLDYSTIPNALAAVCTRKRHQEHAYYECDRNVRILLHPTIYRMKKRIIVETLGEATFHMETHVHYNHTRFDFGLGIAPLTTSYRNRGRSSSDGSVSSASSFLSLGSSVPDGAPVTATRRRLNSAGLREIFTCRSAQGAEDPMDPSNVLGHANSLAHSRPRSRRGRDGRGSGRDDNSLSSRESSHSQESNDPTEATIILKTRKENTPIFHIRQGQMRLSKLNLLHDCTGTDIWNGNTAVQIQPRCDEDRHHRPIIPKQPHHSPSCIIEHSKVMSVSGRGIVAIDGSATYVRKCYIYKCAATGIYVGGRGSTATVRESDIVENGIGNTSMGGRRNQRGRVIARGHSGVYLEQGLAVLRDCNISQNALTGLSAVSPTNAILKISESDIMCNGTLQLELPSQGSESFRMTKSFNNTISADGQPRCRSGLGPNAENVVSEEETEEEVRTSFDEDEMEVY